MKAERGILLLDSGKRAFCRVQPKCKCRYANDNNIVGWGLFFVFLIGKSKNIPA